MCIRDRFAAYANKRNRLFGDDQDQKSKDIYLNAAYNTSFGKITTYAYLLEDDFNKVTPFDNLLATDDRETFGLRLNGSFSLSGQKISYIAEYAKQDLETENGDDFSMPYYFIEAATKLSGATIKLGHEVLGSDDGT